jgi:hypothetical protein
VEKAGSLAGERFSTTPATARQHLDRFSREGVLETLQHLQRLNAWGVNWRSYTEAYLDSCGAFRDAVLSILATIAKQERGTAQ